MKSIVIGNECYIYFRGELIHKTYINKPMSGVTFDIMSYRSDTLKTIK